MRLFLGAFFNKKTALNRQFFNEFSLKNYQAKKLHQGFLTEVILPV